MKGSKKMESGSTVKDWPQQIYDDGGYKQRVTIQGSRAEYSMHDLFTEAQRHTHLNGAEKGHLNFLPSVDHTAVLKDLVKLRGITADTLYRWLLGKMESIVNCFGNGTSPEVGYQDIKEDGMDGDFYITLQELDELKELFYEAAKDDEQGHNKKTAL